MSSVKNYLDSRVSDEGFLGYDDDIADHITIRYNPYAECPPDHKNTWEEVINDNRLRVLDALPEQLLDDNRKLEKRGKLTKKRVLYNDRDCGWQICQVGRKIIRRSNVTE